MVEARRNIMRSFISAASSAKKTVSLIIKEP
jgi:hypothetical protein